MFMVFCSNFGKDFIVDKRFRIERRAHEYLLARGYHEDMAGGYCRKNNEQGYEWATVCETVKDAEKWDYRGPIIE